jgi:hypothetical protein
MFSIMNQTCLNNKAFVCFYILKIFLKKIKIFNVFLFKSDIKIKLKKIKKLI